MLASACLLGLALATTTATAATSAPSAAPDVRVIVQGHPGAQNAVAEAVTWVGGIVVTALPIVEGVAARVPAESLRRLRSNPAVRAVTPDASGRLLAVDPLLGYDVREDDGSLFNIAEVTRAKNVWREGYTGKGVDVALIDSGVSPVPGMTSGNLLHGPDLSLESLNVQMRHLDTFGHGTHMGSIIAGRDQEGSGSSYADPASHKFTGIAPDARLISLKVANNDGATDVSQVIAAIDWVVQFSRAPGFNIRVLNLSFGTDSVQDPSIDPLIFAVENAWRSGIVVVVAGGNGGASRPALTSPARSPLVVAVGADDPNGTDPVFDDLVPAFSSVGTSARRPDVISPGVHVLGLRVPASRIDAAYPSARVGARFFRGTGTSQSAAVTSGLSALYLSRYPSATPDQVKRVLTTTSRTPDSLASTYPGLGVPDAKRALDTVPPPYAQIQTGSTGTGSLEAARGSAHVFDGASELRGEQDIFGAAWDGASWASATSTGAAWSDGTWNGNAWSGNAWSGNAWSGNAWSGNAWSGNAWSGAAWSGAAWSGNAWSGNAWSGAAWSGAAWSGDTWSSETWG